MTEPRKTLFDRSTLGWLIAIIVAIVSFNQCIDSRINSAMNDEGFIRKIASHVRPYIICDSNETILVDGGAMQYLQGPPKIIFNKKNPEDGLLMVVTPKDYLHQAPLIDSLCLCNFLISSQRGKGLEWNYDMEYLGGVQHWEDDEKPVHKFRLEIIR